MGFWFLWDVQVEGPSGTETVRISNRDYIVRSGAAAGETYHPAWTKESFARWQQKRQGLAVGPSGVVKTTGVLEREVEPVTVANYSLAGGPTRAFDYLFGAGYALRGTVTARVAWAPEYQDQPAEADFSVIFTGRLAKRTRKSDDGNLVHFYFEATVADLKGPLLPRRFNGMGGHLIDFTAKPIATDAGDSPAFMGTAFTVQVYATLDTSTALHNLVTVKDSSSNVLLAIQPTTTPAVSFSIRESAGSGFALRTYTVADSSELAAIELDPGGYAWVELVWKNTTFDFYIQGIKVEDDTATVNACATGGEDVFQLGAGLNGSTRYGAARVWSGVSLTAAQLARRRGPLRFIDEETGLVGMWDAERREGEVVTDDSGRQHDITLSSPVTQWDSDPLHGEAAFKDKRIPAAFGDCIFAPVTLYDERLGRALVSVGLEEVYRLYSQGMELVSDEGIVASSVVFDHVKKSIASATDNPAFGRWWVSRQDLEVSSSTTRDGDYIVKEVLPRQRFRPEAATEKRVVYLEDPGWVSTVTETATINPPAGNENWDYLPNDENPYGAASNAELRHLQLTGYPPAPLFADVSGDPEILATSPPGGVYNPPGRLANVLAQLMGKYGPAWDSSTFPRPAFSSLPGRVGYYVADDRSARQAVDDVAGGCLVWVAEADDGTISLQRFLFPEEKGGTPWTIPETDIVTVTETPRRSDDGQDELAALKLHYAKSWTTMDRTSIPPAVDSETRALLVDKWREELLGDADAVDEETPAFETYEVRRTNAVELGERALRLAQGKRLSVVFRYENDGSPNGPAEMFDDYPVGDRLTDAWPAFGFQSVDGIITAHVDRPAEGLLEITVWTEDA